MNHIESQQNTVPLNPSAHRLALEFASEQRNPQKGKKVYLNTLAVYAVHSFLKWLRIESDLTSGESWNPGLRALFDVADLVLPGLGKLECRPILPGETDCLLPIEVTDDRIGYIGVLLEENLEQVHIVGVITEIDSLEPPGRLRIVDFQPIEVLIDLLYLLESRTLSEPNYLPRQSQTIVNLRQWFENTFEAAWQSLESIAIPPIANPNLIIRNSDLANTRLPYNPALSVSRALQIDLGIRMSGQLLALLVTIAPQADPRIYVRLRICPSGQQNYLPPGLEMIVIDENGASSPELTAVARDADNWMQLQFLGQPGERFTVRITLESASFTQNFVI